MFGETQRQSSLVVNSQPAAFMCRVCILCLRAQSSIRQQGVKAEADRDAKIRKNGEETSNFVEQ